MGRTEKESNERDSLIEGTIMGLTRSLSLGKFPGIHKDDPNEESKQQWKGYLNFPSSIMTLTTTIIAIIESSSSNCWKQKQRFTAKHLAKLLESSCREGGVMSKGVKTMLGKPTDR